MAQSVKDLPAMQETWVRFLGQGRSHFSEKEVVVPGGDNTSARELRKLSGPAV